MSRLIEFRAWTKRWGMIYLSDEFSIDVHARTVWKDCISEECVKIMQFTGLIDAHGARIYENDIIEYEKNGIKYRDLVFWEEDSFMVGPTKRRAIYYLGAVNKRAKVIGNLLETPKILKSRLTS